MTDAKKPAYVRVIMALSSQKNGTKLKQAEIQKLCPGVKEGTVGSTLSRLCTAGLLTAKAGSRPLEYEVGFGSLSVQNVIERYKVVTRESEARREPRDRTHGGLTDEVFDVERTFAVKGGHYTAKQLRRLARTVLRELGEL